MSLHPQLSTLLRTSYLDPETVSDFEQWLLNNPETTTLLNTYFEGNLNKAITPLLIYHEKKQQFVVVFANRDLVPPEPGETGCLLSYIRAYGYGDQFLNSDCYGQLSCSSCAVEILGGQAKNPLPREEEYDMLDIDEDKPPTPYTRLSCQTLLGSQPLVLKIR